MRVRVAYCVAEALEYCSNAGFASYSKLSAYTVLFDQVYSIYILIDSHLKNIFMPMPFYKDAQLFLFFFS